VNGKSRKNNSIAITAPSANLVGRYRINKRDALFILFRFAVVENVITIIIVLYEQWTHI